MKKYHVVVSPDLLNRQFVVSVTPYVPGLKRVQDLVGGYIESVPVESLLPSGFVCVSDSRLYSVYVPL